MNEQISRASILNQLAYCTGSQTFYFNPLVKKIKYTDGMKLMAEICQAYWLLTDVSVISNTLMRKDEFIVIKVHKAENEDTCCVIYEDGNNNELYKQEYPFTDFPLYNTEDQDQQVKPAISFYCVGYTLLLPSEY